MLTNLLTLPVSGPLRLTMWIVRTLAERAEAELYDEGKIRKDLAQLEMRFEAGEIDEAKFEQLEEELMARLRESRKRAEALSK
jgi:hypothetical protein